MNKSHLGPAWVYILIALMCFIAIFDVPYGYYTILRWLVSLAALSILVPCFSAGRKNWAWIFLFLLVAFNPISKINFGREVWRVIDAVAGATFVSFVVSLRSKRESSE